MSGPDVQVEVKGRRIVIPNAVMTIVLIAVTALLFMLADNQDTAALASGGFALVMLAAKALQINFSEVLAVLSKEEGDLPEEVTPLMTPGSGGLTVNAKPKSKWKAFIFG